MSLPSFLRQSGSKVQIESRESFAQLTSIDSELEFLDQLTSAENAIREAYSKIGQGALSNVRGSWYEWILAHHFWNHYVDNANAYLVAKLPNISGFDVADLFEDNLKRLIVDLRKKVSEFSGVELVTSNPDFVIFQPANSSLKSDYSRFDKYSISSIEFLDHLYEQIAGRCNFDSLVGFLSVKTSFRPDRRLQIPHEGSLMKALYAHLVTREWALKPRGIKYYAIACEVGEPDRKALKTVATHSITTVTDEPQAAVDEVYSINSSTEIESFLNTVLSEPG